MPVDCTLPARFWAKVQKTETCWIWTGARLPHGYGRIREALGHPKVVSAHRVSYEMHFGPVPDSQEVCHHCDNPSCVRPDHLFAASHKDNQRDMGRKGRSVWQRNPELVPRGDKHGTHTKPESVVRGVSHHKAKLTEADVLTIRTRHANGASLGVLAADYRVTKQSVLAVVKRRSWSHVP